MTSEPKTYLPPLGVPLYWRNETSGRLPAAVKAYIDNRAAVNRIPMTPEDFTLVRDFLEYFINAPCWADETGTLDELRAEVKTLNSEDAMADWIWKALEIGLDPL